MLALGQQIPNPPQWVAAVHDDHSKHRHVHVVAAIKGRLETADLQVLIERATQACRQQRLELDAGRHLGNQRQKDDFEWNDA